MAVIINPYFRGATGNGLTAALFNACFQNSVTRNLRIYPATVAMPSVASQIAGTAPTGFMLSYSSLNFVVSGNSIVLNSGTLAVNATLSGTPTWWALSGDSARTLMCDSIGLTGSGQIVTLSTLSVTAGQSVTINFSMASL